MKDDDKYLVKLYKIYIVSVSFMNSGSNQYILGGAKRKKKLVYIRLCVWDKNFNNKVLIFPENAWSRKSDKPLFQY